MDRVRTPYTRYAWLDAGQTVRVKLRWYPAPPGALPYPGHHLFSSGDWSEQGEFFPWPGAGEDKAAHRNFYPGEGPRQHYAGQAPVGEPEWFKNGVPLDVIQAALADPPDPPADYRPGGYNYPAFVPCHVQLLCATFHNIGSTAATPFGGWRWGGRSKRCGTPTPLRTRGGWKWGGSTASTLPRPTVKPAGGWKWGGSSFVCRKRTLTATRGGFEWGGSAAWHPGRALFIPSGGWKWGGFTTYCYPHTRVKTRGGWEWGGFSAFTFPGGNRRHAEPLGGWKWGGSTVYWLTLGPCGPAECCCGITTDNCPSLTLEFHDCTGAAAVYNGHTLVLHSGDHCGGEVVTYTGTFPPVGGCPGFSVVFTCDNRPDPCQISLLLQAGAGCTISKTIADPATCTPTIQWDFDNMTVAGPSCCGGVYNVRIHS